MRVFFRLLSSMVVLAAGLAAQTGVRYQLSFPNAAHHEAQVQATFTGVRQPVLEIVMSRSSPGRYATHEFAKNVSRFTAYDGAGKPLEVTQTAPNQWNVAGHGGTVVVEYTLFADHADGTYAGIDLTHARMNLPAVLVWAHGFDKAPVKLEIAVPKGSEWRVATQLPFLNGAYTAPDLDRLMDAPIEIGPVREYAWRTGEAHFRLALHDVGAEAERAAYAHAIERITAEAEGVFGAFPKYDDGLYTFLVDYLPHVYPDGMEHRDSTLISATGTIARNGADLLGAVAHEFFHSWNVERMRPRSLEPFDFERANMSGELWFAEGFTNYYEGLVRRRAGLISLDRFAQEMSGAVSAVLRAPGRLEHSAVEMSRMAPFVDAATSIDATNYGNNYISYYTYGQALALGLDLAIREQFPGRSLDEWMRAMWLAHPDVQKPYTLSDLERTLAAVTNAEFAHGVFVRHILGKEPMDYATLVDRAGFVLEPASPTRAWLGSGRLTYGAAGVELAAPVVRDGPLYLAGLDEGDRIETWDGKALRSQKEIEDLMAEHKPGDRLHLAVVRRSGKAEVDVTVGARPELRLRSFEQAGRPLPDDARALREAWLTSKAVHPAAPVYKYCHGDQRPQPFEFEKCPADGSDLLLTPGE